MRLRDGPRLALLIPPLRAPRPCAPHATRSATQDTEEYINIELDASRNKLIRLDIILTAAAFSIAPFNLLAGILGENLVIPSFLTQDVSRFWSLNLVAGTLCMVSFAFFIRYMRYRRLI